MRDTSHRGGKMIEEEWKGHIDILTAAYKTDQVMALYPGAAECDSTACLCLCVCVCVCVCVCEIGRAHV